MNAGGDAAEQVVRLSIEGVEVAARLTGAGAKNLAILLASVLKEEQKTMGKARLSNMIKSGKELAVFSVEKKDLRKFSKEANRYGVLYCVVKSKYGEGGKEMVDVIARAEDSAKINRIVENYKIGLVDRDKKVKFVEKEEPYQDITEEKSKDSGKVSGLVGKKPKERTGEKELQSEPTFTKEPLTNEKTSIKSREPLESKKPSVRSKLQEYRRAINAKMEEKAKAMQEPEKKSNQSPQVTHIQPDNKGKLKGKVKGKGGR